MCFNQSRSPDARLASSPAPISLSAARWTGVLRIKRVVREAWQCGDKGTTASYEAVLTERGSPLTVHCTYLLCTVRLSLHSCLMVLTDCPKIILFSSVRYLSASCKSCEATYARNEANYDVCASHQPMLTVCVHATILRGDSLEMPGKTS